jgi:hypothetical protein
MIGRAVLLDALETILAARRDAQADFDASRTAQLASTAVPASDQIPQTNGALARHLDNAARELADAIRTVDQRDRLASKAV